MKPTTRVSEKETGDAITGSDQRAISEAVQKTALGYIRALREKNPVHYERPHVTLIVKDAARCHANEVIRDAAREELKKTRWQADNILGEGSVRTGQVKPTAESRVTSASSLPPRDSPLTRVFPGQYLSSLIEETITYIKMPYKRLAQEMSMAEMMLQDAVQGKLGLTRGQWVKLGQLLSLPTTFELRQG